MEEIWKDIEGFEGRYQVSNTGFVRTLPSKRYGKEIRMTKQKLSEWGYYKVQFRISMQNKCKNFTVHRLVAKAFLPNPENKATVNHINGIKTDNRVENLEWATNTENLRHGFKTGLIPYRKPDPKYYFKRLHKAKPVVAMNDRGEIVARYPSGNDAGKALGIARGMVCRALKGRRKHAGGFCWKYESQLQENQNAKI